MDNKVLNYHWMSQVILGYGMSLVLQEFTINNADGKIITLDPKLDMYQYFVHL